MRRWYETRLAGEAAMLLHIADGKKTLKRLMLKTQNGTVGKPDEAVDRLMEGDDMEVRIGDEIHNHYEQAATANPAVMAAEPATAAKSTAMDWLKKAAIAAALLGVGGGGTALVTYFLSPDETQAASEAVDTNTQYELRLGAE